FAADGISQSAAGYDAARRTWQNAATTTHVEVTNSSLKESIAMADHNDPNAVNSIFSDIDHSPADLYDLFGFPSDDQTGGEKVVIALTFASVPEAGILDSDMLYRVLIAAHPRVVHP